MKEVNRKKVEYVTYSYETRMEERAHVEVMRNEGYILSDLPANSSELIVEYKKTILEGNNGFYHPKTDLKDIEEERRNQRQRVSGNFRRTGQV